MNAGTTLYGDLMAPVHRRAWIEGPRLPYRKTYALKPGQHWSEASETSNQAESYVLQDDGTQIPVGALIAREFMADGAEAACFTEMWGTRVFVGPDLVCVQPEKKLRDFIETMKAALGGSLAGLPDAIGFFPENKMRLHEAKNLRTRDRLSPQQHRFANVARSIYGPLIEFGITEWGDAGKKKKPNKTPKPT